MSEFNFKSQLCTTREQSERLLALGLKKETADMVIFRRSKNADWEISPYSYNEWQTEIMFSTFYDKGDIIPAWSLHRLLSMLPDNAPKIYWILDGANISIDFEKYGADFFPHKGDIYEGIVKCIEWLIEEGHFNEEYLCQE